MIKKIIIPAVRFDKWDQEANNAIPKILRKEAINKNNSDWSTPNIDKIKIKLIKIKTTRKIFLMIFPSDFWKRLFLTVLSINLMLINLIKKNRTNDITV